MATMQLNLTWQSLPTLRSLKIREYGTVSVQGQVAYKVGRHSRVDIDRAVEAGYREVGCGSSYVYISRGEPSKFHDVNKAQSSAKGFSIEPEGEHHRITFYTDRGVIYSRVHAVPDVQKLTNHLQSIGKLLVESGN